MRGSNLGSALTTAGACVLQAGANAIRDAQPLRRRSVVTFHTSEQPKKPLTFHVPGGTWGAIVRRTEGIIGRTLREVPQLGPGEKQAEPCSVLPVRELPNPSGKARVMVNSEFGAEELLRFCEEHK